MPKSRKKSFFGSVKYLTKDFTKVFSRTLAAGLAYLAINAFTGLPAVDKKEAAGDQIQRSLTDAAQTYSTSPRHILGEPVVLLGSSLVMSPIWAADVKYGHFMQDVSNHHRSIRLKESMDKVGIHKDAVSLATPGQFVSDAYLIVDKYLKAEHKPQVLIYGVAPRDFTDSTSNGLVTSVFNQVAGLGDMQKVRSLFLTTFDENLNFILERTVFLYHKRGRYQTKCEEAAEKVAMRIFPSLRAKANEEKAKAGTPFLLGTNHDEIWKDSLAEYGRRYKNMDDPLFTRQQTCLRAMLATCKERGIKVYVLAMPLSDDNIKLMQPGFYERYISAVKEETTRAGVPLVNLQADGGYTDDDFYDTVHLNQTGGDRFVAQVTRLVKSSNEGLAYTPSLIKEDKQLAMPASGKVY